MTKACAWIAAVLIPLATIDLDILTYDIVEIVFVFIMMSVFVMVERIGDALKDPFENHSNDTPMTALCRTIEISLREQLGETDLPPKIEPQDGVLW
jgi:putative membrane protein